jgi:putative ABC transport system permease protein
MYRLRIVLRRVLALFGKARLDAALDEELRFHLEMETARLVERGMTPEAARYAARRNFGGVERVKETYRDRRGLPAVETLARDFAHAFRTLRRHPGYTAAAVLSLALGIGANTALFSLIDAFVLRPLPYPDPDRLVRVYETGQIGGRYMSGAVAAPVLRDWRDRSRALAAIGAFVPGSVNLRGADGAAVRVAAAFAEPDVFQALGVPALHGRFLLSEDGTGDIGQVVVLGHALWLDRFGGRSEVIGQTIRLDGRAHTVVGIMPAGFEFPPKASAAIWVPLPLPASDFANRGNKRLSVIARVKPGLSLDAARDDLARVSRELEAIYPNSRVASLVPLHFDAVGRTALVLLVLGIAVGFVLLLACANVAHMVLARAMARRHEFAVRLALGASRWRIMRLLLAEGLLLATAGGFVGLATCRWSLDALLSLPANPLPAGVAVSINWTVLGYCALGSALTACAISLVPAWRLSRQKLQADLADAGAPSMRRARHGNRLITIEVALAVVLTVGAGMLVRSLRALADLDFGFRPENVLTMRVTLPPARYPDVARIHEFYDRVLARVAGVPGVEAVGLNNLLPIQMSYTNMDFTVEGIPNDRPGYEPFAEHRTVSADFFRAMRIPLVSGRYFTQEENRAGSGLMVVSKRAADLFWPGQDPVGKRMAYGTKSPPDRWLTIVGVVGDIRSAGLGQPPQAILYAPYHDFDYPIQSVSLVVRTAIGPAAAGEPIRTAVRELEPDLALYWVSTMEEVIERSSAGTRFLAVLLTSFSLLAVALAIVGVYGVMAYVVGQRHREIGVRIAMGASRADVLRLVLGHGARRALVGIGIGFFASVSLRLGMLRPFVIDVGPIDVTSQGGAGVVILLAALAASAVPAYRASRVDPIEALRHE